MATTSPTVEKRTDGAEITGPHWEFDRHDRPTGVEFWRCTGCGREWVGHPDDILHAPECPNA